VQSHTRERKKKKKSETKKKLVFVARHSCDLSPLACSLFLKMDEMGMGMGMEEVSHNEMTGEGGVPEAGTLTYKLEAMLIIFLCAMVGGLVPLRKNTGPRLLSLGNCFSGGIFLAAAFSHMLTEALEGFEKLEWHTEFPVIMFFTVVGILIPFFIERIVMEHDHTAILDRPRSADAGASETSTQQQFSIYALWLMLGVHSIIEGARAVPSCFFVVCRPSPFFTWNIHQALCASLIVTEQRARQSPINFFFFMQSLVYSTSSF
jgi:hypothetical protein